MATPVKKILGLKFKCANCEKVFTSAKSVQAIYDREITVCSGCGVSQSLSEENKQLIIKAGNPGKPYTMLLCIPGIIGLLAAYIALFGQNSDGLVMLLMVVWIGMSVLISSAFRRAVESLNITLDEISEPGEGAGVDGCQAGLSNAKPE
jgi:NAD-dependent SIR2 family protein deacetylase